MKKSLFIIGLSIFMCGFSAYDKFERCVVEFNNKEFDKAKQSCGEVLKKGKNTIFGDLASDMLLVMQGIEEEKVLRSPEKYLKSPISQLLFADSLYENKYYEKAENWYRKVAQYDVKKLQEIPVTDERYKKFLDEMNKYILTGQTKLGIMLAASDNKKEIKEGMKWLKKAADNGHLEALYPLGFYSYLYAKDEKEYKEIFKYFFESAKVGNKDALVMLGIMCFTGNGAEENNLVAYNLWATAANAGHLGAKLLVNYEDLESYIKMFTSLKMMTSADKEHKNTIEYVNWLRDGKTKECLSKKQLSEEDKKKGLSWFSDMADMGLDFAQAYTSLYMISQGDIENTLEVLQKK